MIWAKIGCSLVVIASLIGCDKSLQSQASELENEQNSSVQYNKDNQSVKTTVDWTPVFASWQQGCADSPIFAALRDGLYDYPHTGADPHLPQAGHIDLPEQYKKVVSPEIIVTRGDDASEFSVQVNEGTYHGMKLRKIVAYGGHGNGVNGRYIEVEPTDAELRQFFKNVEFEPDYENGDEYMDFQATIKVNDDNVIITCDSSM